MEPRKNQIGDPEWEKLQTIKDGMAFHENQLTEIASLQGARKRLGADHFFRDMEYLNRLMKIAFCDEELRFEEMERMLDEWFELAANRARNAEQELKELLKK